MAGIFTVKRSGRRNIEHRRVRPWVWNYIQLKQIMST